MRGAWDQSLASEPRFHVPQETKTEQKQCCNKFNKDLKKKKNFPREIRAFLTDPNGSLKQTDGQTTAHPTTLTHTLSLSLTHTHTHTRWKTPEEQQE